MPKSPLNRSRFRRGCRRSQIGPCPLSGLAAISILALTSGGALAEERGQQDGTPERPAHDQLLQKLERMEARIQSLESELHRKSAAETRHALKTLPSARRAKPAEPRPLWQMPPRLLPPRRAPSNPRHPRRRLMARPVPILRRRQAISAPNTRPRSKRRRRPERICSG